MPLRKSFLDKYIDFIYKSADEYKNNLLNKEFLIICKNSKGTVCYRPCFKPESFEHLVGIKYYKKSEHYNSASKLFYGFLSNEKPVLDKDYHLIRTRDILRKKMNTVDAFNITENAIYAGKLDKSKVKKLKSDRLFGNNLTVLGFLDKEKGLVPNTLLNDSISRISLKESLSRILTTIEIKKDKSLDIKFIAEDISFSEFNNVADLVFHELENRNLTDSVSRDEFRSIFAKATLDKVNKINIHKMIQLENVKQIIDYKDDRAVTSQPSLNEEINNARTVSKHLSNLESLNKNDLSKGGKDEICK